MNWLNPLNWLAAPAVALVKSYALRKIKSAVSAKKDDIVYWCRRIGIWIDKIEAVLSFLKSIKSKMEDGELTDQEAKAAVVDAKKLAKEIKK